MKTFPVRLPDELHKAFKVKCAMNGENMNAAIVRMIEGYVKEDGKPAKPKKK